LIYIENCVEWGGIWRMLRDDGTDYVLYKYILCGTTNIFMKIHLSIRAETLYKALLYTLHDISCIIVLLDALRHLTFIILPTKRKWENRNDEGCKTVWNEIYSTWKWLWNVEHDIVQILILI
jgi:hypothetical protein